MTKRLIVAGLLVGTVLFALSGCNTQSQVQENEGTIETQVTQETQEASKAEEVEAVEEVKEAQKVESNKLTLRINCGAAEPYTDQTVLKDFDPFKEAGGYQKPVVKTIEDVTVTNGELAL